MRGQCRKNVSPPGFVCSRPSAQLLNQQGGLAAEHGMMPRMDPMNDTPERPPTRWGVFAQPDFRLLRVGETVSGLGNSITVVALPLTAVVALNAGSTATGLLTGAVWLPRLLMGLPVGA